MSSPVVRAHRARWKQAIKDGLVIKCAICHEAIPAKPKGDNKISKGGKGGLTVDHIIPISWGGSDDSNNLQPAHYRCNVKKGNTIDVRRES